MAAAEAAAATVTTREAGREATNYGAAREETKGP